MFHGVDLLHAWRIAFWLIVAACTIASAVRAITG